MKTLFVQYHSGIRQVITDTADNLLDFLLMEIDTIEDAEIIEHIDKSKNTVKNNLSAGLISPVDAVQMLNPDLDPIEAKQQLERINNQR